MCRLGSTVSRLKLKGIDGGPHKRWSMWFNSTQREEPYQLLTCLVWAGETRFFSSAGGNTGAAGLSSSPHGPYGLGYTRATMAVTEGGEAAMPSQSQKAVSVRIALCNSRA